MAFNFTWILNYVCNMCRLEKEREHKRKSHAVLSEARSYQNDQLAPSCAMLEVGRISSIDAPYRIRRWKECRSFAKTFVINLIQHQA